jgi:hypothetical protein
MLTSTGRNIIRAQLASTNSIVTTPLCCCGAGLSLPCSLGLEIPVGAKGSVRTGSSCGATGRGTGTGAGACGGGASVAGVGAGGAGGVGGGAGVG